MDLEQKVNSTTDVQEACQLGYAQGYEDATRDAYEKYFGKQYNSTSTIEDWLDVKPGSMVSVNWPEAACFEYRNFEARYVGVDIYGFVVLDIGDTLPGAEFAYDGFPPNVCTIK